jgi:hypothetical protein
MGFIRGGLGRVVVVGVVVCLGHVSRVAWAKEPVSLDSETKVDTPEKSDAELMYDAMKRSGQGSNNDAAIDRALARAQKDSEKERKALHQGLAARAWKDPFVDDVVVPVRTRRTARNDANELRLARAEAARARRATAMAQADAALARAETARVRADAARTEAVAARADAVAARQACVALPARDDGSRQNAALHRSYAAHVAAKRYPATGRTIPPSTDARRTITRAAMTVSTRSEELPSITATPPHPMGGIGSGIIIVPIPPPSD